MCSLHIGNTLDTNKKQFMGFIIMQPSPYLALLIFDKKKSTLGILAGRTENTSSSIAPDFDHVP